MTSNLYNQSVRRFMVVDESYPIILHQQPCQNIVHSLEGEQAIFKPANVKRIFCVKCRIFCFIEHFLLQHQRIWLQYLKRKHAFLSLSNSTSATFKRLTALSRISRSLSTFSYSASTNFARTRMRLAESEGRFVNKDEIIPSMCPMSSEAGSVSALERLDDCVFHSMT